MYESILVFLLLGVLTTVVPVAIYLEICLRTRNTAGIWNPFVEGIVIGIAVPSLIITSQLKDAHGDNGLAFLVLSPFIGVGGVLAGISMARIYTTRLKRKQFQE